MLANKKLRLQLSVYKNTNTNRDAS